MSGTLVEALPVPAAQYRAFAAFTDSQVDGSSRPGHQRDDRRLVALADDPQDAMAALAPEILDAGGTRLADPQTVESQQDR